MCLEIPSLMRWLRICTSSIPCACENDPKIYFCKISGSGILFERKVTEGFSTAKYCITEAVFCSLSSSFNKCLFIQQQMGNPPKQLQKPQQYVRTQQVHKFSSPTSKFLSLYFGIIVVSESGVALDRQHLLDCLNVTTFSKNCTCNPSKRVGQKQQQTWHDSASFDSIWYTSSPAMLERTAVRRGATCAKKL